MLPFSLVPFPEQDEQLMIRELLFQYPTDMVI